MAKRYQKVITFFEFADGADVTYKSRDIGWDTVLSLAPRPSEGFGAAFEVEPNPSNRVNTIMPVTLSPLLAAMTWEAREGAVKHWRLLIRRSPTLFFGSTIPASHAAKTLRICRATLRTRYLDEYRLRWISFPKGFHPFEGKRAALRVKSREAVLVHTADALWLAGERLKRAKRTAIICPRCKQSYAVGKSCPMCRDAELRSC